MSIESYRKLISEFVDGALPIAKFERDYIASFLAEPGGMPSPIFRILNDLFSDVDAYSPLCPPGQETDFEISEQRLRERARIALERLESLLGAQGAPEG